MGEMFSSDTDTGSPVPGHQGILIKGGRSITHPFFLPSIDRNKEACGKIMYTGRLVVGEVDYNHLVDNYHLSCKSIW